MTGAPVTRFGLIRHAATLWNEEQRIQGHGNSPLSKNGREMAKSWGRRMASLSWQRILCSDLGRTRETTALINQTLNLPVHQDNRLREQDWGKWTGMTLPDLKNSRNKMLRLMERSGWLFQPPDGESRQQVLQRSLAALQAAHTAWPGESILVVCHEGVIKCVLYHLRGRKFLPEEPRLIKPYHIHLMEQFDRTLRLKKINSMPLNR